MTLMYFTCRGKTTNKSYDQKSTTTRPIINTKPNSRTGKSMLLGIKSTPCGFCGGAR